MIDKLFQQEIENAKWQQQHWWRALWREWWYPQQTTWIAPEQCGGEMMAKIMGFEVPSKLVSTTKPVTTVTATVV
jgi:hypothetical protein